MTFREKWLEAVERKNSVICAGLDPAEFKMGRGDEGLPEGADKIRWALAYIKAVSPFVAAIKPNIQYWQKVRGMYALLRIGELARDLGLIVIEDKKLADIGATNDAGIFYASERADAVTYSPFAGNLEEVVKQAHARQQGLISMVLMSNPEFKEEKNMFAPVKASEGYLDEDIIEVQRGKEIVPHVFNYIRLAHLANIYGADGIVVGAPSGKNHITDDEIAKARKYAGAEMLVLTTGVGAQGGEAGAIYRHFAPENVIVNVSRGLMFPNGSNSTNEEQAEAAEKYRDMVNAMRSKAA